MGLPRRDRQGGTNSVYIPDMLSGRDRSREFRFCHNSRAAVRNASATTSIDDAKRSRRRAAPAAKLDWRERLQSVLGLVRSAPMGAR